MELVVATAIVAVMTVGIGATVRNFALTQNSVVRKYAASRLANAAMENYKSWLNDNFLAGATYECDHATPA